ncbi:DUF6126 family protein [Streptomyces celluloflavus]|uniref:Uncharacterized protein n=2 Tax=Streptomyces TaxID=1883 RepID=A0A4Q9HR02_STRKA|nr:hypothetical protein [Streptomyces kasugaensis]TBO57367.1 hypothetical protein EYS09_23030 [Streptomyces kasugaensis]
MTGASRRKGPPPWRAVRSRTCIRAAAGPRTVRSGSEHHHGRGPLRTARRHRRTCPEIAIRRRTSPRCGVRRARTIAIRLGTQPRRLSGVVVPSARAAQRSLFRRVLLYITVTILVLCFMVLVVYLGRHAGT